MKLHLGCGDKHIEGYVNIDVRELKGVDLIDDIKTISKFGNETAVLIYSSHVLEHTKRNEFMNVLKRWYDVLKPGGILRLAVPDMEMVFEHYQKHKDLPLLRGLLYGGQTYDQNYHYCGWDFKTISDDLKSIGFKSVERYDWRETEHSHIDDFSQCYLPHMDKENGMLMSLNVEAVK